MTPAYLRGGTQGGKSDRTFSSFEWDRKFPTEGSWGLSLLSPVWPRTPVAHIASHHHRPSTPPSTKTSTPSTSSSSSSHISAEVALHSYSASSAEYTFQAGLKLPTGGSLRTLLDIISLDVYINRHPQFITIAHQHHHQFFPITCTATQLRST